MTRRASNIKRRFMELDGKWQAVRYKMWEAVWMTRGCIERPTLGYHKAIDVRSYMFVGNG